MIQSNYFTNINLLNLPVDRPVEQPQQFNDAPVNFNGLPIHRELVGMQAAFIIGILNAAASQAGKSPGRMYQWNMLCHNAGQNQELMDTVILAANYTALGIAKNAYNNIDQAAQASIDYILEARASYLVAIFPELLQLYPPNNQQSIGNMAQQYVNASNEVMGYINTVVSRSGGGVGFGSNNNNNNRTVSFGGSFGTNTGNNRPAAAPDPFVNGRKHEQTRSGGNGMMNTGKDNSNQGDVDIGGILNMLSPEEKTKLAKKHEEDLRKQKAAQVEIQDVEIKRSVTEKVNSPFPNAPQPLKTNWEPSKEQLFPPACPNNFKRVLTNKDGTPFYTLEQKSQEQINMDRDAHRTTTGTAIERGTAMKVDGKSINNRGEFLKVSLESVSGTHDSAFNASQEKFSENLNAYFLGGYSLMEESETSLEAAINKARQMKVLSSSLNQLGAHRIDFDLDQMFVIPKKEFNEFEKVLQVTNLEQFSAKLKAALLDDQFSLAFNSALIQLDSYVKTKLISIIRNELGLSVYDSIGTFVDDFSDLIDDIRTSYPNQYNLFKKNERAFIARYLSLADEYETVGNEQSEVINAIIKIRSSVTVVDFLFNELDVDIVADRPNVVVREHFPKMYEFLDELVSNDYIKDGDIYYGNHWLVTTDNEIIKIFRSQLDNSTILIMKV